MGAGARMNAEALLDLVVAATSEEDLADRLGAYLGAQRGARGVLDFLEVPASSAFDVPPEQAIQYFAKKGLKPTFSYADMQKAAHDSAFTVAKMMDVDLLKQVQTSLESALANGQPFRQWADELMPTLQAAGWWGRKEMVDPLTGQVVVAQLGSASRLETIFRTNLQTSYAAQQWAGITEAAQVAPYLLYHSIDDFRTRPLHREWGGTILRWDHPWWSSHFPPNGYNCRCSVIQMSKEELTAMGLAVSPKAPFNGTTIWTNPRTGDQVLVPKGIDPGFDRNPGVDLAAQQAKVLAEKAAALKGKVAQAAQEEIAKQAKLVAEAKAQDDAAALVARINADQAKAQANEQAAAALERAQKAAEKAAQKLQAKATLDAIKAGTHPDPGGYLKQALGLAKKAGTLPDDPAQALEAVQAGAKQQAQKQKVYASKNAYKKALLEGKIPSKGTLAGLDLMPPAEKDAFVAQVAAELKAKQEAEAKAAAEALAAKQKAEWVAKMQAAKAAKKAQKEAEAKAAAAAAKQQAEAQAQADAAAAAAAQAQKDAEAAQAQAQAAQAAAKVVAPAGKAPKVVIAPAPNMQSLQQVGGQQGSNTGGTYLDTSTGRKWYIKEPASEDIARNEVTAAKLYELAGIEVPNLHLVTMNGRPALASEIVDGLAQGTAVELAKASGTAEGFAVDAWLADWDVVGLSFDNLLLKGGRAVRIDVGASLRYRAQGGLKGAAWGDSVTELDTLRNAAMNPQAAAVFGKLTDAQIEASVARVLTIPEKEIRAVVELYGPTDPAVRKELADRLIARRADLLARYPNALKGSTKPAAAPADANDRVTDFEHAQVVDARSNGLAFLTDADAIEDHSVVVHQYTDGKGKAATRGWLKLRPDAAAALAGRVGASAVAGGGQSIEVGSWADAVLAALKGINSRASKGVAWEPKDVDRLAAAINAGQALGKALSDAAGKAAPASAAELSALWQQVQEWTFKLYGLQGTVKAGQVGTPFGETFPHGSFARSVAWELAKAAGQVVQKAPAITWTKLSELPVEVAETIKDGRVRMKASPETMGGVEVYEGRMADGTRVRFVPDKPHNPFALRGLLYTDTPGHDKAATGRTFEVLDELGIPSARSTADDRDLLYLNAYANLRFAREPSKRSAFFAIDGDKALTAAEKVKAKLSQLKADGIDVTASQGWKLRDGVRQAFGHGRAFQLRPDLDNAEFDRFKRDGFHLFTNVQGLSIGGSSGEGTATRILQMIDSGGQYSSQVDRIRTGTYSGWGSSVSSDMESGGASYLFSRVKDPSLGYGPGIYWRAETVKRLDAVSFFGDQFGEVKPGYESMRRGLTVAEIRKLAGSSSNETIFKGSLSLFDAVDFITLHTKAERDMLIRELKARGYKEWPDGRPLEVVVRYKGDGPP